MDQAGNNLPPRALLYERKQWMEIGDAGVKRSSRYKLLKRIREQNATAENLAQRMEPDNLNDDIMQVENNDLEMQVEFDDIQSFHSRQSATLFGMEVANDLVLFFKTNKTQYCN